MKKRTQLILIIIYTLATLVVVALAGAAANISCGIGATCDSTEDYLPGMITASIILSGGFVLVWINIKKYKRLK